MKEKKAMATPKNRIDQRSSKVATAVLNNALIQFIDQLESLALQDFPSEKTSLLLRTVQLVLADLAPYIFYSDKKYTRNRVYKAEQFELILMCWQPGQASAIHGHEGQKCWMRVMLGELTFDNYTDGLDNQLLKKQQTIIGSEGFVDGPAYIHGVKNTSAALAISLHLYARPFSQCDAYDAHAQRVKKIQLGYHSIDGKLCSRDFDQ
jgi:cysteine dioxygenase